MVIPVRNDAGYLRRCLRALAVQTRAPDEIVVVDNGSTDSLHRVLREYPAVRVVPEPVPGVARAASAGYDAAGGDVILRCDADSIPPPTWVEQHLASMAPVPRHGTDPPRTGVRIHDSGRRDVVAVSGIARFGPRWATAGTAVGFLYSTAYRAVAGAALGHAALWGSDMAFRRDWWLSVRGGTHPSRDVHDDLDLSFRVTARQRVAVDPRSRVTVSWRAVVCPARIVRQLRMAGETMRVNWAQQRPWSRWRDRLAATPGTRGTRGRRRGPRAPW